MKSLVWLRKLHVSTAAFVLSIVLSSSLFVQLAAADGPAVHIVAYGETLSAISQRYNVPLPSLFDLNRLNPNGFIFPGQRIILPAAASPESVAATSIRLSGVPILRQKQTLTCEEAAAAMASRGRLSEAQLVRVMPRSADPFAGIRGRTNAPIWGSLVDYGTYAQALQIGLNRLGYASKVYYGQTYAAFKAAVIAQLRANRPVVWWTTYHEQVQKPVWVTLPSRKSVKLVRFEHSVTIVGMTSTGFLYNDPQDAKVRAVSFATFQRVSAYFGNMALVLSN
jgi:LysM repeat protein